MLDMFMYMFLSTDRKRYWPCSISLLLLILAGRDSVMLLEYMRKMLGADIADLNGNIVYFLLRRLL